MTKASELSTDMVEFAAYLRRAATLIADDTIEHVRAGTRALRETANRVIPAVHAVEEDTFEGLRFRVYRPTADESLPGGVFFHGGGWSHLDIDVYDPVIRRLALESGLTLAAIDFPLVPDVRFPANLDACVRFVQHVSAMGGEAKSLALIGDSAGANLALGAAITLRDVGDSPVGSLSLVYGAYDLNGETDSYRRHGDGSTPLTAEDLRRSRAFYIPDSAQRSHPLVSPINADLSELPPVFLAVASHDPLYDENIAMAGKLGQAGCDVTLRVYPGTIHGFLEAESVNGSKSATHALQEIGHFAARHAR
jgi:acetyl esterase